LQNIYLSQHNMAAALLIEPLVYNAFLFFFTTLL